MVATIAPQLLEIPLILACFGFSTALLGISGADIRVNSNLADFVTLEDNNWLTIQLVLLIVSALTFFFSAVGLVLAGRQFGGRRGEYTGKGTSAWILMGLIFLLLSGLLAGSAGAVTAFAVTRKPSFSAGSAYSEPFDLSQQLYLRQIIQDLVKGVPGSLTLMQSGGATSVDSSYLGIWDVSTLAEANDNIVRYLNESTRWKAEVIVTWFTLGPVFLTMVVHFALPFVWKWLGLIRTESPKTRKKYYYENKQYSYNNV
ncbi:hypothetical protein BCV69DRAFT_306572 [Microstroma glucosiphilum]|uniref:Uncharacterized protein n=1 Tax=Pseudomicrostroma glucosiphilum TaxID=1684307 RepID=A0A316UAW3_9BASI|nr:hypothetical protein BCV69DRAFT_306572 [Pseudomicrostroma glucosiphilum]PWN22356.1 hypothetical protein BCV69DRAFT_306572 [Pseudomicrostroma glucosiphilum]